MALCYGEYYDNTLGTFCVDKKITIKLGLITVNYNGMDENIRATPGGLRTSTTQRTNFAHLGLLVYHVKQHPSIENPSCPQLVSMLVFYCKMQFLVS